MTIETQKYAEMLSQTAPWSDTGYTMDRCEKLLEHPEMELYTNSERENIRGFAAVLKCGMGFEPMVMFLCVAKEYQRQGIGGNIMDAVEKAYPRVYLTVTSGNPALSFWEKRGYRSAGEIQDYEQPGIPEIIMYKETGRGTL